MDRRVTGAPEIKKKSAGEMSRTYWVLAVTTGRDMSSVMKSSSSVMLLVRMMSMEVLLLISFLTAKDNNKR